MRQESQTGPPIALWALGGLLCSMMLVLTACAPSAQDELPVRLLAHELKNTYPLRLGGLLVLTSNCESGPCLIGVDVNSGAKKWEWADEKGEIAELYHGLQAYSWGSLLALPFGRSLKVLDWQQGELVHDLPLGQGRAEPYLTGQGETVYAATYGQGPMGDGWAAGLEVSLATGRQAMLFRHVFSKGQTFKLMPPIRTQQGGCLIYSIMVYGREEGGQSWLIRRCPESDGTDTLLAYPRNRFGYGIARPPLRHPGERASYWQTTDGLLKLGHSDFAIAWESSLRAGILTSEIFDLDSLIIYPSESLCFYLASKVNGAVVDTLCGTPGTPGRLFLSAGEVLFVGGSDGLLYSWRPGAVTGLSAFGLPNNDMESARRLKRQLYADDEVIVLLEGSSWIILKRDAMLDYLVPAD